MSLIDRACSVAATRLLDAAAARGDASSRAWLTAMRAELCEIDSGWSQLLWAIGGVRLGCVLAMRRYQSSILNSIRRPNMFPFSSSRSRAQLAALTLNVVVLFVWWLAIGGLVQAARHMFAGEQTELAITVGCLLGTVIAHSLRASLVEYFLAGMFAFGLAELPVHTFYGIHAVQGGPAHFSVMIAGVLAVVLCGIRRFGAARVLASIAAAFVVAELAIHAAYGLHPYRDTITHAAIAIAAIAGGLLGMAISRTRERFVLPIEAIGAGAVRVGG